MDPSPIDFIQESTKWVVSQAQHVKLGDKGAFESAAASLVESGATTSIPSWLDGDFHFFDGSVATYNYIFVVDALNFCFWPSESGLEYDVLARAVRSVAQETPDALSPSALSKITEDTLQLWFPRDTDLPNLSERCRLLR